MKKKDDNIVPMELTAADGPVYIDFDDMLAKTKQLTRSQLGIVWLLFGAFFTTGKKLPADDKQLAELAGVSLPVWRKEKAAVMPLFRGGKPIIRFRWTSPYE
jgi:uncharacterized protein YdaU (DUF1376 family)